MPQPIELPISEVVNGVSSTFSLSRIGTLEESGMQSGAEGRGAGCGVRAEGGRAAPPLGGAPPRTAPSPAPSPAASPDAVPRYYSGFLSVNARLTRPIYRFVYFFPAQTSGRQIAWRCFRGPTTVSGRRSDDRRRRGQRRRNHKMDFGDHTTCNTNILIKPSEVITIAVHHFLRC
ncbi:hypothetical protein JYU34_000522 [Plutella xylostella]|uniref:Uncharacterized protein n=1 Tax=Plutella xylostella TaxID=51655 RepID=A0ABQ7R7X2_PLUXY|nr:hypothetical protein JYU34_000522 [Plutella xylostella]